MKLIIDISNEDYEFIKDLKSVVICSRGNTKTIQYNVINAIKNGIPYEERPHGKGIKKMDHVGFVSYICSECGDELELEDCSDSYYCANCGAEMREADND